MKRIAFIAIGLATLVSGCASTQDVANYDDGIDRDKVANINRIARARGVEIHWVRYPQRKQTAPPAIPSPGEATGG